MAAAKSKVGGCLLRVLGDVDEHRAGAAGLRDLERFADGGRNIFGARDEEVVLGHGQRDAGDVDFLKGVGAEHLARNLAGDADASGMESSIAVAMPVTRLVAPGPLVAMATPTLPEARA